MNPIIFPFLAASCFAGLFICYKIGERKKVNPVILNLGLFLFGAIGLSIYAIITSNINKNPSILIAGFVNGFFFTSLAVIFLNKALKYGKLNISTIIMSLSFIIPVILSIFIWSEIPNLKKIIGIILAIISIIMIKGK